MDVLFCCAPFNGKLVDADYEDEQAAAMASGFTIHLFDFEELTRKANVHEATRKIKRSNEPKKLVYRGWMLKPAQYTLLYETLLSKNYVLINSPTEYQHCHYLPDSYAFIKQHTPKTTWLKITNGRVDYDEVFRLVEPFGSSPLIIKDFVKSQKHYWDTACFVPSAADKEKLTSVVNALIALQNDDLNEGLVIRDYVELSDLATHSKSGMPLKQEYRLFFLNKSLVGYYEYWEEGEYSFEPPPINFFEDTAKNVESNFFSMDVAKTKTGEWIIIELGDGQVAGLPDKANRYRFYDTVNKLLKAGGQL